MGVEIPFSNQGEYVRVLGRTALEGDQSAAETLVRFGTHPAWRESRVVGKVAGVKAISTPMARGRSTKSSQ